jgi:hypothetical protein
LSSRFEKSGLVLQDLVNELGRRLDYKVTNGRYQGTISTVGFDGIWTSPEGNTIITEVKTTDAYRIALDTIAGYRQKLLDEKTVAGSPSILIVVGRQDTGELEAQVRGSRHAWDIRLISAEALIKLTKLKENSDEPETGRKIRSVLTPVEYTRLDRLVDVMFTAATDLEPIIAQEVDEDTSGVGLQSSKERSSGGWEFTDATLLQQKRDQIIIAVSKQVGLPLIKKSRALYWSADHSRRVVCTISKRSTKRPANPYWYAYHPQWDEFLAEGTDGRLVLGCMDLPVAFAIPRNEIHAVLDRLNTTESERGTYWHLHIVEGNSGAYELLLPKSPKNLPLGKYRVDVVER